MARTFFVGGNFKMNGSKKSIKKIVEGLNEADLPSNVEVVIAPPSLYLDWAKKHLTKPSIELAAQNAFHTGPGAYTGEIAIEQIKDVGAQWVILGHSERRTIIKESDEVIAEKTVYAINNGVSVILCIGELLSEREAGSTLAVCDRQLDAVIEKVKDWSNIVVAYEPVWAIGTGLAATPDDAQNVHAAIRKHLAEKIGEEQASQVRIIYGGSVNGKNAASFKNCGDVDGFLVGGASLKPEFIDIIKSRE
ncbi:Triosephosphate isomerase [Dipodascopsis uninucleata]